MVMISDSNIKAFITTEIRKEVIKEIIEKM